MKYKAKLIVGISFALLTALLNAVSITMLIPLFDSFGAEKKFRFRFELTNPERVILYKEKIFGKSSLDGLQRVQKFVINFKLSVNRHTKNMEPAEIIWAICKMIIPLHFLKLLAYLLSVFFIATTGYTAVRDIRQELFDRVQNLPLTYFYREKSGIIMSRIINDADIVAAVISSNLRDAIINIFYVITHLVILLYLNTELLLIAILTVPVTILPVTLFTKKITKSTNKFQERLADLNGNIQELISGIKVIRSFGTEQQELNKFQEINQKTSYRNFKGQFYLQMAPGLVELSSSIVVLLFFAAGVRLIFNGTFTQGEFMAFLLTLLFILRPVTQLSQMFGKVSQANAAGERIFGIMDREIEHIEKENLVEVKELKEKIQFQNISFTYPNTNKSVITNLSLDVKKGDTVALVGFSGSGKSTLMDLIPRFYDPSEGCILFDGIDIKDISLQNLRSMIGIVTQDIFLFHGTVFDNIAYGRPGSTQKEITRAARLANAHDFIMEMENGYDTILGTRGLNLSGGQRQRLVIARVLLRNPAILILDEATSALDSKSESLVTKALDRLFKNRTTFIIAHRLSTIRKANRILVMDQGKIIEDGNHDQLLELNGVYAKLYENQFANG